jgi:nucleotide-binding universal stress UspA family protein
MNPQQSSPTPLLIAYDGSDLARHAIEQAGALFAGARAVVLSVYEPIAPLVPTPVGVGVAATADLGYEPEQAAEAAEGRAKEVTQQGVGLAEQAGLLATGATTAAHGIEGVANAIVDRAHTGGAKTIVMGSHGRSAIGAALLGSVSHAVLHRASVPVLVVPASPEPD